jgi:hypothetical protein
MPVKIDPPLQLELKCSKRLIKLMIFIYTLALVAGVLNSLPALVKLALLTTIAIHGYFTVKQLNTQQYCLEHTETGWRLAIGNEFVDIEILPSTVISIVAIFLHVKIENNPKQTLVIFSDALAEDDYRCLIVRLKTTAFKDTY